MEIPAVLDFLRLRLVAFDFGAVTEGLPSARGSTPRALLSFPQKTIATDSSLSVLRKRFSILHEVAHYVLPEHQHHYYFCDDKAMGPLSTQEFEKQANAFAADLLFLGDRFTLEANSRALSAATVKELADRYDASFESTARRMVEKSVKDCLLAVFRPSQSGVSVSGSEGIVWDVRYCKASPSFAVRYFTKFDGAVSAEFVAAMGACSFPESLVEEISISIATGDIVRFRAEFFQNFYNIFCFLQPIS